MSTTPEERANLPPWAQDILASLKPFTTEQELAELVGVTARTLRAWRSTGRLRGVQTAPGGRVRYGREHVAALLSTMPAARGARLREWVKSWDGFPSWGRFRDETVAPMERLLAERDALASEVALAADWKRMRAEVAALRAEREEVRAAVHAVDVAGRCDWCEMGHGLGPDGIHRGAVGIGPRSDAEERRLRCVRVHGNEQLTEARAALARLLGGTT